MTTKSINGLVLLVSFIVFVCLTWQFTGETFGITDRVAFTTIASTAILFVVTAQPRRNPIASATQTTEQPASLKLPDNWIELWEESEAARSADVPQLPELFQAAELISKPEDDRPLVVNEISEPQPQVEEPKKTRKPRTTATKTAAKSRKTGSKATVKTETKTAKSTSARDRKKKVEPAE